MDALIGVELQSKVYRDPFGRPNTCYQIVLKLESEETISLRPNFDAVLGSKEVIKDTISAFLKQHGTLRESA